MLTVALLTYKAMNSWRAKMTGIFFLALVSLTSSAVLLRGTAPIVPGSMGKDAITLYLRRFEALRRVLPAHATVGYETDLDDSLEDRAEVKRFYLAQYALAPVIVVPGVDRDVVVANYENPGNCRICKSREFVLLKDLGDGLMLFRKAAR